MKGEPRELQDVSGEFRSPATGKHQVMKGFVNETDTPGARSQEKIMSS